MDNFFLSLPELYYMGSFTLFHAHFLVLRCSFPEVGFHRVSLEELLPRSSLFWVTGDQDLFVSLGMLSVSMSILVEEILVTLPMSWLCLMRIRLVFHSCSQPAEVQLKSLLLSFSPIATIVPELCWITTRREYRCAVKCCGQWGLRYEEARILNIKNMENTELHFSNLPQE